jgi:hypothetical protein
MGFVWPRSLDCFSFPDVTKAESVCLTPEAILKQSKVFFILKICKDPNVQMIKF